jgi:hypothetical protein
VGKNSGLSRDQKRKAKLQKRADRTRGQESLAYAGNKYKTPVLIPFLFRTEVAIHEAYVLTDHALKDDTVEAALVDLIARLRQGAPLEFLEKDTLTVGSSLETQKNLVITNVQRNWRIYSEEYPLPRKDDIIGVLRTILNSLEIWRSKNMHPQGYVRYLEGFVKQAGASALVYERDPELEDDPDDE